MRHAIRSTHYVYPEEGKEAVSKLDMRTGSTGVMVLRLLADEPMYGYQIVKELQTRSEGYFRMEQGTLYPALHRLERQKLLSSFWQEADGRRRKYYRLTSAGTKALAAKKQEWTQFATGVSRVLGEEGGLA